MKLFILLLSLTLAFADHHEGHSHDHDHGSGYVVKTHEDLVRFRNICAEQVHASAEDVAKYVKWDFADEEKSRCYLKCIFEHFGLFDATHGFDVHKIHEQLAGGSHVDHADEVHQKIADCADNNAQGSDACTWAYRGGMCFMRSNLQLVQQSVKA
ncbi:general odorant-binding protein 99b [Drosophila mojavensis]|uniref:Odorant-binding protein 99b n=2 Tax=mojavensis species complex TaxID=198037 RepID=B4K602_DROMO|nr:general odorant-binding protein 99b [Drosophila mojavensis]XP_017866839.1 PREDICTED: general odorant-binding protein 99b [Drosophila arizonae]EDW16239.1 Odorant-binding protein 99b [Drosophila mojavensis]